MADFHPVFIGGSFQWVPGRTHGHISALTFMFFYSLLDPGPRASLHRKTTAALFHGGSAMLLDLCAQRIIKHITRESSKHFLTISGLADMP
jgi:hypothetical protein